MNTSSNASTERRNPMPKPFTTIVPPSFKAVSEAYQYAPAVRIGDRILISGIIGADAEGRLPPDFRGQAENVFTTLEAILKEAGATLDDVASLHSYHVGDLHSQLSELVDIKAKRIRSPHPAWTGVGVTQLGVPEALLEISAVAVAHDHDVDT
jgi:enamine deaminase RidA (YjgF/YER057c/UK114 family)